MKMPVSMKAGLVAAAGALALALPAFAEGKEGKEKKDDEIKLADCPAAVQKTINDNAAGGTVSEVEKETKKDGSVVYEAEVKKAEGKKIEVKVAADGKLIKVKNADDDEDNDAKEGNDDKDDDED